MYHSNGPDPMRDPLNLGWPQHDPRWPYPQPVPHHQPTTDLLTMVGNIFDRRMDRFENKLETIDARLEKGGERFTAIETKQAEQFAAINAKLAEINKPPPSPIPALEVWFKVLLPPLAWFVSMIFAAWWTGSLEAALKFADAARKAAGGG